MRISANLLIVTSFVVVAACASQATGDTPPRPNTEEITRQMNCPRHQTAACVERINQPQSCRCIDQDELIELIERDESDYARRR